MGRTPNGTTTRGTDLTLPPTGSDPSDGFPPYVSAGQPITSAWGNDVVYTLGEHHRPTLHDNIHGGYASVANDVDGYVTIVFGLDVR